MTKRLLLMRHAKSDWSDPWLADRERPLAPRGERDALRMGLWLRETSLVPDKVIVSPARRAVQTWRGVSTALDRTVPVEVDARLHVFDDHGPLLEAIRENGGDAHILLVIGHNEAVHDLALTLARTGNAAALERLRKSFPTAAVAVIDLPGAQWPTLRERTPGRLVHLMRPKDLRP